MSEPIIRKSLVNLVGSGEEATIIRMADDANAQAVIKDAFYDDILSGDTTAQLVYGSSIVNLTIDGNADNQSSGSGYGLMLAESGSVINNVHVAGCRGIGVHRILQQRNTGDNFPDKSNYRPRVETWIPWMSVFDCDDAGFHDQGAGDAVYDNLLIGSNAKEGLILDRNLQGVTTSVQVKYVHLYSNNQSANTYQLICDSSVDIGLAEIRDGFENAISIQSNSVTRIYQLKASNNRVTGSTSSTPLIHIEGDRSYIGAARISGEGSNDSGQAMIFVEADDCSLEGLDLIGTNYDYGVRIAGNSNSVRGNIKTLNESAVWVSSGARSLIDVYAEHVDAVLRRDVSGGIYNLRYASSTITTGILRTGSTDWGTRDMATVAGSSDTGSQEYLITSGFHQFFEIEDPDAPSGNRGQLYARDDGNSNTELVAQFNSGQIKQVASEDVGLKLNTYTDANRGAAGTAGRVIFNSDDSQLNIDDGVNWTLPDGTTT